MKKVKAHMMLRVTKEYPRRLMMNADTPYEAYAAMKLKYSVPKNRQDLQHLMHNGMNSKSQMLILTQIRFSQR